MLSIGITGGIGSGKSTVCQLLNTMGYPTYDSDLAAQKLMSKHLLIIQELKKLFGTDIYINQALNKALLAEKIFNNQSLLNQVNKIVHPLVWEDMKAWRKKQKNSIVFIEAAILIESGFYLTLDKNILITAPLELKIERIKKRNKHLSEKDILSRINKQLSDKEKEKHCDYFINNDEKQALIPQVLKIINSLKQK